MAQPDNSLSVLLIESDADVAGRIRQMLDDSAPGFVALRWAQRLSKGVELLARGRYGVVLVDLRLPEAPELAALHQVIRAAPLTPVIALGDGHEDAVALTAVRAGAEDFLAKSRLEPELLLHTLRYSVERHARRARLQAPPLEMRKRRGRVTGFLGVKGGVGATTIAVNVAAALAAGQRRVILAELRDSFGTMSQHFSQPAPPETLASLISMEPQRIDETELTVRLLKPASNLGVLLGPQSARDARDLPVPQAKAIVEGLARMAKLLVLDLPRGCSGAARELAAACDFIGLVMDREPGCVAAARVAIEQLRLWNTGALTGLVIVHRSPLARPLPLDQISADLGLGVAGLIPPAPDECLLAQQAGTAVVEAYGDALVGQSLAELATRLAGGSIILRKTA